jgi:hypothetical protein
MTAIIAMIGIIMIGVMIIVPPVGAVDGVIEINQALVTAAGGFPYKIITPGSYRLTGDLTVSAVATDAIDISAAPVTIDLNGFSLTGPSSGGTGISDATGQLTVENGKIQQFALGLNTSVGPDIVSNMTTLNTFIGLTVENADVSHYRALSTTYGISCRSNCMISNATISAGTTGISIGFFNNGLVSGSVITAGGPGIVINNANGSIVGNTVTISGDSTQAINFLSSTGAYGENTIITPASSACVSGGTSMGGNVCNGVVQ